MNRSLASPSARRRSLGLCAAVVTLVALAAAIGSRGSRLHGAVAAGEPPRVAFISFDESAGARTEFAGTGMPGSEIRDAATWDDWVRDHDREIRARVNRGIEDSISNLILYGTSFTPQPRVDSWTDATAHGKLSPLVERRIADLLQALAAPADGKSSRRESARSVRPRSGSGPHSVANPRVMPADAQRLDAVRRFLTAQGIEPANARPLLTRNLERFVAEQQGYEAKLIAAQASGDSQTVFATRETLYAHRGLSVDTSLMPNYALDDTLRVLKEKGVLSAHSIRHIAIVGPGLDFADKREGYDYYPEQTLQPFAMFAAVRALDLASAGRLAVTALDLNPMVLGHVRRLADRAREGIGYRIQLPLDPTIPWTAGAMHYWSTFGAAIGSPIRPIAPPAGVHVKARAVEVGAGVASRLEAFDDDIVTQRISLAPGGGFDLVVATNILVYYDAFEQSLAMTNIGRMLNPGGIFLCNNVLPHPPAGSGLKFLGRRTVNYATDARFGDDVVVYQRVR
jgi:SAM-dependent methyltransferase